VSLRSGITTGTCAAAAAKAAAVLLAGGSVGDEIAVRLPSTAMIRVPLLYARLADDGRSATAAVRKDAGDDPDVTDGLEVRATVSWNEGDGVRFLAGEGIGTVTKPGLQVPPGDPAINPGPRKMIAAALAEVTPRGLCVEIAIPGGREVAAKTFNPRLGIVGGLSVLGTTGIVRPYCIKALRDALKCALDVATACGIRAPAFVPGNIGAKAAKSRFRLRDEQLIEVGNEWGFVLDLVPTYPIEAILLAGHPGKLAKLAAGHWDTHSSRSAGAVGCLAKVAEEVLGHPVPESSTAEGIFTALASPDKKRVADDLAGRIRAAAGERIHGHAEIAVLLVDMAGQTLGFDGELAPWQ
jgi:cobalt-precorrin-5B (C1)-methyltransferase